jgi:hypothetical protein
VLQRIRRGEPIVMMIVGQDATILSTSVIEMPSDPQKYAREFYRTLRQQDQRRPSAIYLEMPPDETRWVAVRDRLLRATG